MARVQRYATSQVTAVRAPPRRRKRALPGAPDGGACAPRDYPAGVAWATPAVPQGGRARRDDRADAAWWPHRDCPPAPDHASPARCTAQALPERPATGRCAVPQAPAVRCRRCPQARRHARPGGNLRAWRGQPGAVRLRIRQTRIAPPAGRVRRARTRGSRAATGSLPRPARRAPAYPRTRAPADQGPGRAHATRRPRTTRDRTGPPRTTRDGKAGGRCWHPDAPSGAPPGAARAHGAASRHRCPRGQVNAPRCASIASRMSATLNGLATKWSTVSSAARSR